MKVRLMSLCYLVSQRYRLVSLVLALVSLAVIIGAPDTYPIQPK